MEFDMSQRTCSVDGCDKERFSRGWCSMHYRRWARNGDPSVKTSAPDAVCSVASCGRIDRIVKGLCPKHLARQRKGFPLEVVRRCSVCATIFSPVYIRAIWCSKRCSRAATRWSTDRKCEELGCGRPHAARGMCAMHWRRWARATGREKPPEWDERRRATWKKRYALSRGAADAETFDYIEIYERDGWICGICDEPVDRTLAWPDPLSVSLDHIVPVSQGGAHSRENAQCAHLVCNVRKGDSLEAVAVSA